MLYEPAQSPRPGPTLVGAISDRVNSMRLIPSFTLAVALAMIMVFPFPIGAQADDLSWNEPPSRYGYTPVLKQVATLSSEAICVDAGDVDNRNNDDVVIGTNGAIHVYTNNGGSGANFGMTLYKSITLAGYYITKVKVVDYDNDNDRDIIALGQDQYALANEVGGLDATIGSMRVFYLENTGTGFTLETYYDFDDVFYGQFEISGIGGWFWTDGKYDLDTADVDGDGDIDTMVIYNRDTDGDSSNNGETIQVSLLTYSGTGLARSNIHTRATPSSWNIACFVRFADFNMDSHPDIVYTYGGVYNNAWFMIEVRARFHTGTGASWGVEYDLDPSNAMQGDGTFPTIPYALEVGNFHGDLPLDVAISINDNRNVNPPYCDAQLYIIKKRNPSLDEFGFYSPSAAYSEDYNYQFRGIAVGNLDNTGADDVVAYSKQDDWSDENPFNAPAEYGLSVLAGRSAIPVRFTVMKVFETQVGTLPSSHIIKDVAIGELDGNSTYEELVYVGNNVIVALTTFPPNNLPMMGPVSMSPNPVRNNNETCTINITVQDLDNAGDLIDLECDLTMVGLNKVTMALPTGYHETDNTIAYYEFTVKVPSWIPQDNYVVPIFMYDRAPDSREIKSNGTFPFRVKQFNREPFIVLDNTSITIPEDQVTYIENIYEWFMDEDVEGGYDDEPLNITMKTAGGQWLSSVTYFETYKAELVNSSGLYPQGWVLKITPFKDFNHYLETFAANAIVLRATDSGGLESEELVLRLYVAPVNDLPTIPPQGRPNANFAYMLEQDDDGFTRLVAKDLADDPDDLRMHLTFSLVYDDPEDESWLYVQEDRVYWRPTNDQVGSHRVILRVNDTESIVEQVLWFNVSNVIDNPHFLYVENSTKRVDLTGGIQGRYVFTVYEHEEFNLTIKAEDVDITIGEQTQIFFKCNLTMGEGTYLDIDPDDPTMAYLHFLAEKRYGYPPTYEPEYPPIDTEIILEDEESPDIMTVLPIRIRVINVNDPPIYVGVVTPTDGQVFPILYQIPFSAETALDPDTDLNDTLTYQWDFDFSNGFQVDHEGMSGKWDFPAAGTYTITLMVTDNAGNSKQVQLTITVNGVRNDDDFDGDGLPNVWEREHSFNEYDPEDASVDSDGDGLSNLEEFLNETDPRDPDTDNDGVKDGEDWDPLDPNVQVEPKDDGSWVKKNFLLFIILLILLFLIILILIFGLIFLMVKRNRKRAEEEEMRRKMAEEMQKNIYEGQDLYANLPPVEQPGMAAPGPTLPVLPPPGGEGDLDDIFGGAGSLPAEAEMEQPTGEQPQSLPPRQAAAGDLTDLLD
ncbi:MAG: VCBS repeat-containing protein [Candidatus Thermoplasmatota archaeon]|nr:VCBS repeat-containing protein [Candidatus Thermoplasmatota archaeon]